ncbi:hypothetical protein DRN73_03760 [Candidatus Pacearchaeota archaeon]|nr:MAG: hypothetical protein DRN73_03760 [Candidatus Pacearchaeota archaeon]
MKNKKIVIMSIVIALIALLIIILSLSFLILNQKNKKANVENLINPFGVKESEKQGETIINILEGDHTNKNKENLSDGYPHVTLSDISFDEDTNYSLDLDDYINDTGYALSEINWTFSGNQNISIIINNSTHIANFSAPLNWNGYEDVTFRATDPDGMYNEKTITITVNPVDDALIWNTLLDKSVDEDSPNQTIVYENITEQAIDPDDSVTLTILSSHAHFNLEISGDNLIINDLEKDWYGNETVILDANGIQANFTLTITHLLDDCKKICSWNTCYEFCD